jgi:hypothetical protein
MRNPTRTTNKRTSGLLIEICNCMSCGEICMGDGIVCEPRCRGPEEGH